MKTASELLAAGQKVLGDRAREYDSPGGERSAAKAAAMWSAATGKPMSEYEAWLFLICLKAVRLTSSPGPHDDSATDGGVYFGLAGESKYREKPQPVAGPVVLESMSGAVRATREAMEFAAGVTPGSSPQEDARRAWLARMAECGRKPMSGVPPWGESLPWGSNPAPGIGGWTAAGHLWVGEYLWRGVVVKADYPIPVMQRGYCKLDDTVRNYVLPKGFGFYDGGFIRYLTKSDREAQEVVARRWRQALEKRGNRLLPWVVPPWGDCLGRASRWLHNGVWWVDRVNGGDVPYPIPVIDPDERPLRVNAGPRASGQYVLPEPWGIGPEGARLVRIETPSEKPAPGSADAVPTPREGQQGTNASQPNQPGAITRKAIREALQGAAKESGWYGAIEAKEIADKLAGEFNIPSGEPDEQAQQQGECPQAGEPPAVRTGVDVPAQGAGGVPVLQPEGAGGE